MLEEKFPRGHREPGKGAHELCHSREVRGITVESKLLGLTYYQIYIGGNLILPMSKERDFTL